MIVCLHCGVVLDRPGAGADVVGLGPGAHRHYGVAWISARPCVRCHALVAEDAGGAWVDVTGGDGCGEGVHSPSAVRICGGCGAATPIPVGESVCPGCWVREGRR